MNLSTMRRIDALVGRPLCLLAGAWARLVDRFSPRREPGDPGRILFIELSEMGSTILAAPAIQRARGLSGQPPCFVIFRKNAASLRLLGLFDEEDIFCFPDTSLVDMAEGVLRFRRWCRERGVQTVVDLELFARVSSLLAVASGARQRVGFDNFRAEGLYRGAHLTHQVAYNPYQHMSANFMALMDALEEAPRPEPGPKREPRSSRQVVGTPPKPELQAHLQRELAARCALPVDARLVVLNPEAGALLPIRNWPRSRFIELGQRILRDDPRAVVVLMGVPAGHETIREIYAGVDDPRCIDFVGCTRDLDDVLQLCHMAEVLVTNDSGPAHFATLTPVGVVTLFGPETPVLYGPRGPRAINLHEPLACSPCLTAFNHRNSGCTDNVCLQSITVDRVLEAIEALAPQRALPA
jgi:ADP-heptose:LPS heptosyltransferase